MAGKLVSGNEIAVMVIKLNNHKPFMMRLGSKANPAFCNHRTRGWWMRKGPTNIRDP